MSREEVTPADPRVEALLRDTRANGGLAPVDLEQFWADQAVAVRDPFSPTIPQIPMGIRMEDECVVFAELGLDEDVERYLQDDAWRVALNRAYNDKAEEIVGRRLLDESPRDPTLRYHGIRGLHDVFEASHARHSGSDWLMASARDGNELSALLDRVEQRDLRAFVLPPDWKEQKARLTALGIPVPLYRGQRGPVTFAASIFGVENLVFLIHDNPALAERFRDAILNSMLGIARVLDEEAGHTPETAPRGFAFCDDNSYLLTPEMYESFGYPILEAVFGRYSPDRGDARYQHSDSDMGHLLPVLGRLGFTKVNFGPRLTVRQIRRYLPHAVIEGQLAPFTFSRDDEAGIVTEFLRDLEQAREGRGLLFATAGSVNQGSRLTGLRLIMAAIQRFGRNPYA